MDIIKNTSFLLLFIGVAMVSSVFLVSSSGEIPEIPVDHEGYVETSVFIRDQNLQLVYNCHAITMAVGVEQASSIQYGLRGELWERPGSHDLIKDILEGYGVEVAMVRVHDLRDGAYVADLFLYSDGTVYRLDSRPSDSVAIALRAGAPIEVKYDLVREHGQYIC